MVLEKIKVILAGQFDVEEDSIKPETDLQDDLARTSLRSRSPTRRSRTFAL